MDLVEAAYIHYRGIEPGDYITYRNALSHVDGCIYRVLTVGAVLRITNIVSNNPQIVHVTRVNRLIKHRQLCDPNYNPKHESIDTQIHINRILQIEIEK